MASDLRCEEVLHVLEEESLTRVLESSEEEEHNAISAEDQSRLIESSEEQGSQFCSAYKDSALLYNTKVFKNMLELEEFYLPDITIYEDIQDEIKLHMRKIVTEWMLDVCIGKISLFYIINSNNRELDWTYLIIILTTKWNF